LVVVEAEVHTFLLEQSQVNLDKILNLLSLVNHLERQQQQVVVEETHTMRMVLPVLLGDLVDLVVVAVVAALTELLVIQVNILTDLTLPHLLEINLQ
tara:strand:+ start:161 stop:451 length:291 start_codon:yes stop_codon:yes gene_type:complete